MAQDDNLGSSNNDTSFDDDLDMDEIRTDTTGLDDEELLDTDRDTAL